MMKYNLIIIIIMGIFNLISCKKFDATNEKKIYIYGTSEFEEKEKELKISLEKATKLYLSVNQSKAKNYSLAVIYGDNYIFNSILLYDLKTGIYTLSGIWINGNSGEINKIKTNNYIKISLSEDLSIYYHDIPKIE